MDDGDAMFATLLAEQERNPNKTKFGVSHLMYLIIYRYVLAVVYEGVCIIPLLLSTNITERAHHQKVIPVSLLIPAPRGPNQSVIRISDHSCN